MALTEEAFLAFADRVGNERHFYIIAEYLYAVDCFESYDELKAEQSDKPYYIPGKEELLKYKDNFYMEETKEILALGTFLRDKLKLKRADDVLSDLKLGLTAGTAAHKWSSAMLSGWPAGAVSAPWSKSMNFSSIILPCATIRAYPQTGALRLMSCVSRWETPRAPLSLVPISAERSNRGKWIWENCGRESLLRISPLLGKQVC